MSVLGSSHRLVLLSEYRMQRPEDTAPAFLQVSVPNVSFLRGPGSLCEAQNNTVWKAENVTSVFHPASGSLGPTVVQGQENRLHLSMGGAKWMAVFSLLPYQTLSLL